MSKVILKSLQKMETSRLKTLLNESLEMFELSQNSRDPGDMSYLKEWIQALNQNFKKESSDCKLEFTHPIIVCDFVTPKFVRSRS